MHSFLDPKKGLLLNNRQMFYPYRFISLNKKKAPSIPPVRLALPAGFRRAIHYLIILIKIREKIFNYKVFKQIQNWEVFLIF